MPRTRLKFVDVYYKKGDKEIERAIKVVKEAFDINKNFFMRKIPKFIIRFVYSRKEFDRAWEGKTESWQTAFSDVNRVVLFPGSLIKKYSTRGYSLKRTLVHEINHIFYSKIFKLAYARPLWILEGLALNIDGYKLTQKDRELLKRENVLYYATPKKQRNFYPSSYLAVKYLLNKYGRKKIFLFLKKYAEKPTKERYVSLLKKFFEEPPLQFKFA